MKRVGEKVLENEATDAVRRLFERIKNKFTGDPYAEQLLAGVESDPDSKSRQSNLKNQLAELLEADADFREEVTKLVTEAQGANAQSVYAVQSGITAGRDAKQSAGRDAVGRDKVSGPSDR
jgi:hypothetical protein